jgi:hypothetical protein
MIGRSMRKVSRSVKTLTANLRVKFARRTLHQRLIFQSLNGNVFPREPLYHDSEALGAAAIGLGEPRVCVQVISG